LAFVSIKNFENGTHTVSEIKMIQLHTSNIYFLLMPGTTSIELQNPGQMKHVICSCFPIF
jgi:hypothetical protein